MRQLLSTGSYVVLLLLLGLGLGCESDSPVGPTFPGGAGGGVGAGSGSGLGSGSALTRDARAAMERAILDEYQAEATYSRVIEDFGEVIPFTNVVYAEERHSESIGYLYRSRDLSVPANPWNRDNVARFRSLAEACAAAAETEERNIAMYDELLALELPLDVGNVFGNNRRASLEHHLPAFLVCAGA